MSKKKKKAQVFYYQSSKIKKNTWKMLCEMVEDGIVVYVQSGAPTNPPPKPPGS